MSRLIKKYYLILWQLILLAVIAAGFYFIQGWIGVKSVWFGGVAWLLPSWYFIWGMKLEKFRTDGKKMMRLFILNEVIKWILSLLIITVVLVLFNVEALSFLAGYISIILTSIFAALAKIKQ